MAKIWTGARAITRHGQDFVELLKPYWNGADRKTARALIIGLLAVATASGCAVAGNSYANRLFMDAAQQKDGLGILLGLAVTILAITLMGVAAFAMRHLRMAAAFGWRRALTSQLGREYLEDRTAFVVELGNLVPFPDQRLAEDCKNVPNDALELLGSFCLNVVSFFAFGFILWQASPALTLPFWGGVRIEGYMLAIGIAYVVLATLVTHMVARKLTAFYREGEGREAALRSHLLRARENAEAVALTRAGVAEYNQLMANLAVVGANWRGQRINLARTDLLPILFVSGASAATMAAFVPQFLAGAVSLGQLVQLGGAMGVFVGTAAWFLNAYDQMTKLRASMDRLLRLKEGLSEAFACRETGVRIELSNVSGSLQVRGLTLSAPSGAPLNEIGDFNLEHGKNVLLPCPSGKGKSTLLRAIAGVWPWGEGLVRFNNTHALFLPQSAYVRPGRLRDAVMHPIESGKVRDDDLHYALRQCGLERFIPRLEEEADWDKIFSGGERQRLVLARAFLVRPDWLFLDEATSALDASAECAIYEALVRDLNTTTLVSASHREGLRVFHDLSLEISNGHAVLTAITGNSIRQLA